MVAHTQKRLSLDTNLLFDLADRKDFAHDLRETCQDKGYALLMAPTVVAERYFLQRHGDAEQRRLATRPRQVRRVGTFDRADVRPGEFQIHRVVPTAQAAGHVQHPVPSGTLRNFQASDNRSPR